MQEKLNGLLMDFNRMNKEFDELYHKVAPRMEISDSAFSTLYTIYDPGDGCLQKGIYYEFFANRQTVNSSTRRLIQKGYTYFKQGVGRDKHIFLTEAGKQFVEKYIIPVAQRENAVFTVLEEEEQKEFLRLINIYMEGSREELSEL